MRRFQKIDVPEPSEGEAIEILMGLKPRYEAHHNIRYTEEAVRAAVELSAKYMGDRKLPDKAIDIIDEVGAAQMLVEEAQRKKSLSAKISRMWSQRLQKSPQPRSIRMINPRCRIWNAI